MQTKLYIPTSSLNFNSIFSTESISPHSFYRKRQFGYRRNRQIRYQPIEDALFAYDKMIRVSFNDSEYEEYPIFVAVASDMIKPLVQKSMTVGDLEIFMIERTVYFDHDNFEFFFPDLRVMQTIVSKSLSSFETKTVSKYLPCFKTTQDYALEPADLNVADIGFNTINDSFISDDEKFDSLKGLLYCLLVGFFFSKPKNLADIELLIAKIQNEFGGFKSDVELNGGAKPNQHWGKLKRGSSSSGQNPKLKSVLEQVELLKHKIIETFGRKNEDSIIKDYIQSFNLDIEDLKPFFKIPNLKDFICRQAQTAIPNAEFIAEILKETVKSYDYNKNNANQKEKLDIEFKDQIANLNNLLRDIFQPRIDDTKIEIVKSLAVQLDRFEFYNFFASQKINDADFDAYQRICHILLANRKRHQGETSIEIKNELLTRIGEKFTEEYGKDSAERRYLLDIYNLLNDKTHGFNLKFTPLKSLQGFAAFMINIDSAERLEEYLVSNEITSKFIPFSFFGTYVGFSGLGRTLTDKIFESRNYDLMRSIDSAILKREFNSRPLQPIDVTVSDDAVADRGVATGSKQKQTGLTKTQQAVISVESSNERILDKEREVKVMGSQADLPVSEKPTE